MPPPPPPTHTLTHRYDPFISRAMGPNPKCERMRAGSLRIGGQGETHVHALPLQTLCCTPAHIWLTSSSWSPRSVIQQNSLPPRPATAAGLTTTHDDHLLIIGDAAGHIDPLTGEGIHTAMMGGKAAAETLLLVGRAAESGRCLHQGACQGCARLKQPPRRPAPRRAPAAAPARRLQPAQHGAVRAQVEGGLRPRLCAGGPPSFFFGCW